MAGRKYKRDGQGRFAGGSGFGSKGFGRALSRGMKRAGRSTILKESAAAFVVGYGLDKGIRRLGR